MRAQRFVSLGLRRSADPAPGTVDAPAAFRRMLDEAIAVVAETAAAGTPLASDTAAAIAACRAGIRDGLDAAELEPLAHACCTAARRFATDLRSRSIEQRAQIGILVASVREAVAALAGSHSSVDAALFQSAERFERLAGVEQVADIQAALAAEVGQLKRLAIQCRTEWEQTERDFARRVVVLEQQLEATRREAEADPLTNVANRRTFERTCRDWIGANHAGFVLASIDVDDFKAVNDTLGHAVGDRVLVTIAETLASSVRSDDLVARVGGDEFAILAATLTLQQAARRFGAIVNAVEQACRPLVPDDRPVSVSIGIAEFSAGDTAEILQKRADAALYSAKSAGKRRLVAKTMPYIRDLLRSGGS